MDVPGPCFTMSFDKSATTTTSSTVSTGITDLPSATGMSPGTSLTGSASAALSEHDLVLSDVEVFPDHSNKDSGQEGELSDSEVIERIEELL